jgi:hypothetical protein
MWSSFWGARGGRCWKDNFLEDTIASGQRRDERKFPGRYDFLEDTIAARFKNPASFCERRNCNTAGQ